ncbi:peptide transporter family 1 [Drosophila gunungcola]|uniref:peptide transporter family 1 n=1 Tax=Drosophila gunungcola TaxID=103775 RepID=UPI0022DF0D20|nr:peptide transporter family 1 [Drosophila gunungcola]
MCICESLVATVHSQLSWNILTPIFQFSKFPSFQVPTLNLQYSTCVYILQHTYPLIPSSGFTQLRVFSGIPDCEYRFNTNLGARQSFTLKGLDYFYSGSVPTSADGTFKLTYTVESLTAGCSTLEGGTQQLYEATAHSLFLRPAHAIVKYWYEDEVQKSNRSWAFVRTLANLLATTRVVWTEDSTGGVALDQPARNHDLYELNTGGYAVQVADHHLTQVALRAGGVYALLIGQSHGEFVSRMVEVTAPNSMSVVWLVPQYVVMTLGEVMFSVTGLEFSYSQSPASMKSVLQACWLLTVAFGNVIVVVVAELKFFESQASEFFLFAGLMFFDMLIFMFVAHFYQPYDEVAAITERIRARRREWERRRQEHDQLKRD